MKQIQLFPGDILGWPPFEAMNLFLLILIQIIIIDIIFSCFHVQITKELKQKQLKCSVDINLLTW